MACWDPGSTSSYSKLFRLPVLRLYDEFVPHFLTTLKELKCAALDIIKIQIILQVIPEAHNPYSTLLANSIASCSVENLEIHTIGPNISSRMHRESCVKSEITVGGKKYPFCKWSARFKAGSDPNPQWMVPPSSFAIFAYLQGRGGQKRSNFLPENCIVKVIPAYPTTFSKWILLFKAPIKTSGSLGSPILSFLVSFTNLSRKVS